MAKIDWCSQPADPLALRGAAGSSAAPSTRRGSAVDSSALCWASKHAACPSKMMQAGYGGKRALTPQQQQRLDASQAIYTQFMRDPPRHWFYCHLSLGDARRKISAGVVALMPGATLRARVDGWGADTTSDAEIQIEHLVSYVGMGIGRLECFGGCECEPQLIDAHKTNEIRNVSVFESHSFVARAVQSAGQGGAPAPCELVTTVLRRTSSGSHKLKFRSITVSTTALADLVSASPPPPTLKRMAGKRQRPGRP